MMNISFQPAKLHTNVTYNIFSGLIQESSKKSIVSILS